MRKLFVTLLVALLLSGCSGTGTADNPPASDESTASGQQEGTQTGSTQSVEDACTIPGTWTVPSGWTVAEKYSSADKLFYVEEGHEDDETPDNISIEVGTNRYSMDDHENFRNAIVQQLSMQLKGLDAEVTGSGSHTDQDYILYTFTISEEDMVTKQFYIVGEQRYCLVHLTNFTGAEEADEAAQSIADSFVWAD